MKFRLAVFAGFLLSTISALAQYPPYPPGTFYNKGLVSSDTGFYIPGCPNEFIKADGTGCSPAAGINLQTEGTPNHSQSLLNFHAGAGITITNPSAGIEQFDVTASGGIVPPNPSTTTYVVLGDSKNLVSNATASPITATAVSYNSGVVTVTAPNTFVAGDWVGLNAGNLGASCLSTNPYFYQVISTGLSTTQFEFNAPACTGSGTGAGGTFVYATYFWPLAMSSLPYFQGHGTVLNYNPTSGETVADMNTFYTAQNLHAISPAVTGNPGYIFLQVGFLDYTNNSEGPIPGSVETAYQTIWATAHADGWKVVQLSLLPNSCSGPCNAMFVYANYQNWNAWLLSNLKTQANTASGQFIDYYIDVAATVNQINNGYFTAPGQAPHLSDQGNAVVAFTVNDGMMKGAGGYFSRGFCANSDLCPAMNTFNSFSSDQMILQVDGGDSTRGWGTVSAHPGAVGTKVFMNVRNVEGQYMPTFDMDWNNGNLTDGQGPLVMFASDSGAIEEDTDYYVCKTWGWHIGYPISGRNISLCDDGNGSATHTLDLGNGGVRDKTGNLNLGGIGIGTDHVPGHAFDCSGVGCPATAPIWVTGTNGFAETYACTVSGGGQTCIHAEVDTGTLNNNTPTTVTLPITFPNAIFGVTCSDNGSRVQAGNDQPVGANIVGLSAPFTTFFANTPSTTVSAHCKVDGY